MNATAPVNLELAPLPRGERDAVLARLRRERDEARRTRMAQQGEGWAVDVAAARQPVRQLDPDDVAHVMAGKPLPPHHRAGDEDTARKVAALDVAIKHLAQQQVEDAARELQQQADEVADRLRTLVTAALKVADKLPTVSDVQAAVDDARHVVIARDALRGPDVQHVPAVRRDPALEEVAVLLLRGLEHLAEAAKELRTSEAARR